MSSAFKALPALDGLVRDGLAGLVGVLRHEHGELAAGDELLDEAPAVLGDHALRLRLQRAHVVHLNPESAAKTRKTKVLQTYFNL